MARKSALEIEVERLNEKYCKHTKNKLVIDKAYGGVQVCLRNKNRKGGQAEITTGHLSPMKTLQKLYEKDSKGWLQFDIERYENDSRM